MFLLRYLFGKNTFNGFSEPKDVRFCWKSLRQFLIVMFVIILAMLGISGIQGYYYGVNPFAYILCKYQGHDTGGAVSRHRGFEDSKICVKKLKAN